MFRPHPACLCRRGNHGLWTGAGCSGDAATGGKKKCTCEDHVENNWLRGCEDEGIGASCPVSCNACPAYQTTCSKSETSQSTAESSDATTGVVLGTLSGVFLVGAAVAAAVRSYSPGGRGAAAVLEVNSKASTQWSLRC